MEVVARGGGGGLEEERGGEREGLARINFALNLIQQSQKRTHL